MNAKTKTAVVTAAMLAPAYHAGAQTPIIIRGGWVFTATNDQVVRNRGILVRGGVFQIVNGEVAAADTAGARVITLADSDYVLPGLILDDNELLDALSALLQVIRSEVSGRLHGGFLNVLHV